MVWLKIKMQVKYIKLCTTSLTKEISRRTRSRVCLIHPTAQPSSKCGLCPICTGSFDTLEVWTGSEMVQLFKTNPSQVLNDLRCKLIEALKIIFGVRPLLLIGLVTWPDGRPWGLFWRWGQMRREVGPAGIGPFFSSLSLFLSHSNESPGTPALT